MECICNTKNRYEVVTMLQCYLDGNRNYLDCCLKKMDKILKDFDLLPLKEEVIIGNMPPEIIDMFLGQYY